MKAFWDLLEKQLGTGFAGEPKLQAKVRQLQKLFTEERDDLKGEYLSDPELAQAYLAYYVPLNFEKIRVLLASHRELWPQMPTKAQRWVDLGSGPGTAVLAALAVLKDRSEKSDAKLPALHIDLVDTNADALKMAAKLITPFAKKLGFDITLGQSAELPPKAQGKYDLALAANILNELPPESGPQARELLMQLWDQTQGVILVLEPGHRVSSQRLVRFRERLLKEASKEIEILGPCTHQEKCPVYRTKHWCHFSEPATDGRLIDLNLRIFKNPRGWLKFSYLLAQRGKPRVWDEHTFRAIGDLHPSSGRWAIDLCRPNQKFVLTIHKDLPPPVKNHLVRGARVKIDKDYKITARTMTQRKSSGR